MPTYNYKCSSCKKELEVIHKITDKNLTDCPKCNQPALTKQITSGNFILKGSGWFGKSK